MAITEAIIRLPRVKALTGFSRTEIYRREGLGIFPQRVSLGKRAVGWREEEVLAWIRSRERKANAGTGQNPARAA